MSETPRTMPHMTPHMGPRVPPLEVGISTCPNDTFAFAALLEQRVEAPAMHFSLEDVESLNEGLMEGRFDVAKASFHAALHLSDRYCVLPVGAALGYGVGPLLLKASADLPDHPRPEDRVLCPGVWTTATLLYRLFVQRAPEPSQVLFSEIMPALSRGEAEYGVVIHEGRFTYAEHRLAMALDLGARWEAEMSTVLPLGGILARRDLGEDMLAKITASIRSSLQASMADADSALPAMRRHAQEFDDEVLREHVRLYVNESTLDLGTEGRNALQTLEAAARQAGLYRGTESLLFA
jgi:5,8-dihydroxy-2-naphthoate synthase